LVAGIIRDMEALAVSAIRELDAGVARHRARRATRANQHRIAEAERALQRRGAILDFLNSCSHAMDNVLEEAMRFAQGEGEEEAAGAPLPANQPPPPPPPPAAAIPEPPPIRGRPLPMIGGMYVHKLQKDIIVTLLKQQLQPCSRLSPLKHLPIQDYFAKIQICNVK
jgi:hypothetical protein